MEGPVKRGLLCVDVDRRDERRCELLDYSGQDLRIRYQGQADLVAHKFDMETVPADPGETLPVALRVRINDLVSIPSWTVLATLNKLPVEQMLPIGRRMG